MISSKGDTQHSTELSKTRRPRVHLTYDLEANGAIREVELPFVVGVLADLSAPTSPAATRPRPSPPKATR